MHFSSPADHPCLPGHFPGHPLVPGVVVLEQVLLAAAAEHGQALSHLRLPQVKFLAPLYPGQQATVQLQGQGPRLKFQVSGPSGLLVRGELVIEPAQG